MLKEYLSKEKSKQILWRHCMPGVEICQFSLLGSPDLKMHGILAAMQPLQFESFFCLGGRLVVENIYNSSIMVEEQGIFLLSDASGIKSCRISGDLCGVLVAVDAKAARESFRTVCAIMGFELNTEIVKERMIQQRGCLSIFNVSWSKALFESLAHLSPKSQGQYCVFKSVELLYLLCSASPSLKGDLEKVGGNYIVQSVVEVGKYMETHLEEKITIAQLCKKFSISGTALKKNFHNIYGASLHQWLMTKRMKRAGELLRSSDMGIQEIAQAVGYDGLSQFNTVFKRYYGITPGKFKKMSEAVISGPFQ